jgi:hypothetical protein
VKGQNQGLTGTMHCMRRKADRYNEGGENNLSKRCGAGFIAVLKYVGILMSKHICIGGHRELKIQLGNR